VLGCLLLLTGPLTAARSASDRSGESPPPGEKLKADLVLLNGKVVTFDDQGRRVTGIAMRGREIVAVGSDSDVRAVAGPATCVVDVEGRLVLPGLVDAHSHTTGVPPDYLDLTGATSIPEIVHAVEQQARGTAPGQWIVAAGPFMLWRGWDDQRLKEKRLLTRWDLDPVSPQHPVLLMKEAGHALVLNSLALSLLDIRKESPDPRGQIQKDAMTGEPTGILLESAMELALSRLPAPTSAGRQSAARHASDQLLEYGITTVANMSMDAEEMRAFQALYRAGKQPLVTTIMCPGVPTAGPLQQCLDFVRRWPLVSGFGDDDLRLGALKIFVDGGITGRAAWFKRPYKGRPGFHGIPQVERETLFQVVRLADRLGWQLHLHACGDAAAELALDALEAAQRENGTTGRRHILTHLYVVDAEMMARMKRLGVVAVLQPNFVHSLGEHMRAALSDSQLAHIIPYRGLLDSGVTVAMSADGLPQNPLLGVHAAVARKTDAGNVLGSGEAVTVEEALRAYTRASAYALFEEERRGSLEVGKIADVIVMDRDLFSVSPEEIKEARVLLTVKSGGIVFDRLRE
jgi:hypothetical protein